MLLSPFSESLRRGWLAPFAAFVTALPLAGAGCSGNPVHAYYRDPDNNCLEQRRQFGVLDEGGVPTAEHFPPWCVESLEDGLVYCFRDQSALRWLTEHADLAGRFATVDGWDGSCWQDELEAWRDADPNDPRFDPLRPIPWND